MAELFQQIQELFLSLFNNEQLKTTLSRPEFTLAAFIALSAIIFTETGLLVGFFLPGDSLLVTAGFAAAIAGWNIPLLLIVLSLAAIIGDSVGYLIGYRSGPKLFHREESFFFRKSHLLAAQAFYERHGAKTIIMARFMPFVRTFAPVVAGIGRMEYKRFLFYNIIGGIGWVVSMVLVGYYLTSLINPLLRPIFGAEFDVGKKLEYVILGVIFISVLPIIITGLRSWMRSRNKTPTTKVATTPTIPPV